MILIADGGSTKTTWCLLNAAGEESQFETEGYHPFFVNSEYICHSLQESLPLQILEASERVSRIFLYSAGGGYSVEADRILVDGLLMVFPSADITIETDLLAAARSLLGKKAGFAAILGTGTNTCLFDGEKVTLNIESLGFLLGDEGSGSYIGRKIIGDYVRGFMPEPVRDRFYETFKLSPTELLNKVYEDPLPNRFCATFTRFAGDHLQDDPYCYNLVYNSFMDFFRNLVMNYPDYQAYHFNCVGSVAYYFKSVLEQLLHDVGMKMGKIEKDPLKGLMEYHKSLL